MGNSCFVYIGGVKSHQEIAHSPRKKVIGLEFLRFKFHKSLCWLEIQISTHLAPKTVDVQNYFYYISVICVQAPSDSRQLTVYTSSYIFSFENHCDLLQNSVWQWHTHTHTHRTMQT